jgi:nucleoside-diphosphate-sugar epimerase
MNLQNKLEKDLCDILEAGQAVWPKLAGSRLFITGGTGFIGTWVLESLVWLNDKLNLGIHAVVLTRDANAFIKKAPHLAGHAGIELLPGDIRDFAFPDGNFSYVIHGATDASAKLNAENPIQMFDTILEGTRRALDFTVHSGAKDFLFISSGAVYGEQSSTVSCLSETELNGPDCTNSESAYAEGKRAAELLCTLYAKQYGIRTKLARCFAFVGPYLPMSSHFAIGNFIRDAMSKKPIHISGDGTPFRSYLYASDLTLWLWTILILGQTNRPYNVGSDLAISIAELATLVNSLLGGNVINIAQKTMPGAKTRRYVPSIQRAGTELGLRQSISLEQAIIKTATWHGWEQHR